MNCMKCGRETAEEQVFCQECLTQMEDYPVKPGTAVYIPARNPEEEAKKTQQRKKAVPTLSEQVLRLKRKVVRLRVLAVVLLLVCGALAFLVSRVIDELELRPLLGQNYHTKETTSQTEPETP